MNDIGKLNWQNIEQLAEFVINQELTPEELTQLRNYRSQNPQWALELDEAIKIQKQLAGFVAQQSYRGTLRKVAQEQQLQDQPQKKSNVISLPLWWKTAALAASVAIIASIGTATFMKQQNDKSKTQYQVLKRQIDDIQNSQKAIIRDIKTKEQKPSDQYNISGTGFALNNEGYLVTNYHVTEGADSVYIQTSNGIYHKADIVSYDINSDLAILKISAKDFKFSKQPVPYSFAQQKTSLAGKVFTLGYPDDNVVYYEGYVSSANGYKGDSLQYRLSLPANPGQSGAPILDTKGNVVGVITGKGTQGATYAVSTKALTSLIDNLPEENKISLPSKNSLSNLSREQQVAMLDKYTFLVRVYKNN